MLVPTLILSLNILLCLFFHDSAYWISKILKVNIYKANLLMLSSILLANLLYFRPQIIKMNAIFETVVVAFLITLTFWVLIKILKKYMLKKYTIRKLKENHGEILFLAAVEEIYYRGIVQGLLIRYTNLPFVFIILIVSAMFLWNHRFIFNQIKIYSLYNFFVFLLGTLALSTISYQYGILIPVFLHVFYNYSLFEKHGNFDLLVQKCKSKFFRKE